MNQDPKEQLTEILKTTNGFERTQRFSKIRDTCPRETLDAVIQLMHSPDQELRRRAGSSLSWFLGGVDTKADQLANMLLHHADERVRLSCAIHLMPLRGQAVDQAFLAALKDSSDKVVQIACVEVGARAGEQAAAALSEILTHTAWRVRLEACKALITLKKADARVVSALETMSQEPEAGVYDSECDEQPLSMESLLEFCEELGILAETEKSKLSAQPQPEPWGKLHTILARARQIAATLESQPS